MAVEVETLLVRLEATQRKFEKQLKAANDNANKRAGKIERRFFKMNKSLTRSFVNTGKSVARSFLPLAGIVAGPALIGSIRSIADSVADIGDRADDLGIGVESFQALRFAAEQSSITVGQFENGLERLNIRVGEVATTGKGEAAEAFELMGIEVRAASGEIRDTDAVLVDIAKAFTAIPSEAARASLAADLFGRTAGPVMSRLLIKGEDAIRRLMQVARDSGAVLDEALVRKAQEISLEWQAFATVLETNVKGAILSIINLLDSDADFPIFATGERLAGMRTEAAATRLEIEKLQKSLAAQPAVRSAPRSRNQDPRPAQLRKLLEELTALEGGDADLVLTRTRDRIAEIQQLLVDGVRGPRGGKNAGPRFAALTKELQGLITLQAEIERQLTTSRRPAATTTLDPSAGERDPVQELNLEAEALRRTVEARREGTAAVRALNGELAIEQAIRAAGVAEGSQEAERIREAAQAVNEQRANLEGLIEVQRIAAEAQERLDAARQTFVDAQADVVARTEALRLEAQLIGLSADAAERARIVHELLTAAKAAEIPITQELIDKVNELADAYGKASEEVGQVQTKQDDLQDLMGDFKSVAKNVLGGFISDLKQGKSATEALLGALSSLADQLLNIALNLALNAAFGGFKDGGLVKAAGGGLIRGKGGPRDDKVPALLSDGEFVVNAAAARENPSLLRDINEGRLDIGRNSLARPAPRLRAGGQGGGAAAPVMGQAAMPDIRVVNAFDADSFLSEALSGRAGERTFLNFVRENKSAMRNALGVA